MSLKAPLVVPSLRSVLWCNDCHDVVVIVVVSVADILYVALRVQSEVPRDEWMLLVRVTDVRACVCRGFLCVPRRTQCCNL